ncbi:hypothetical protein BH09GEM1_BH09GEM1_40330 [soil metagenome]
MSRFRGFVALALTAAFVVGCLDTSPFEPVNNSIVVQAVLDVDARDQFVIVQKVDSGSGTQRQVTGATVTITGPDGRALVAREVTDSIAFQSTYRQTRVSRVYRLSLDEYGVILEAGQVYSLRIVTPAGQVVTGSTIIPVSRVPFPPAGILDTIDPTRDSIAVSWTPGRYARAYELNLGYSPTSFYAQPLYRAFVDSAFVMSRLLPVPSTLQLQDGFVNNVIVLGVDANYYDYYRRGNDLLGVSGIVNHLVGGVGVFGSVGRVSQQRVWVRYPRSP